MSWLATIREALRERGESQDCGGCRHFEGAAARIEHELPGLAVLSSAHASVRGRDGLCMHHQRLINGRSRCGAFGMREA